MSKQNVLLAIHNLSELKKLANNATIRSSLKFYLYGINYKEVMTNVIFFQK